MFAQALEKILSDHASGAVVRGIEAGQADQGLWSSITEAGFADLLRSEEQGGAGLSLPELFPLLACLGRYGVPLPIGQSFIARSLLPDWPDLPPAAMVTLAPGAVRAIDGSLCCPSVPGGQVASHVLTSLDGKLLLLDGAQARRETVGDPRSLLAHLHWDSVRPVCERDDASPALLACAAALTAALISGSLHRALEMSLAHCNTRSQFGKAIGKFQAIQQQISVMAQQVLAGSLAAQSAFQGTGSTPSLLAAAVAKSRASEAAAAVAASAHAVHGAIGMTDEFDLSLCTRRLHEWRLQYGAELYWNTLIGNEVLAADSPVLDIVRAL
jgi:alkylation response protein AidB-like acyl-CoA dehydrogenase